MSFNSLRGGIGLRVPTRSPSVWRHRNHHNRPPFTLCPWTVCETSRRKPCHRPTLFTTRYLQHKAPNTALSTPPKITPGSADIVSRAEQRRTDWSIIRKLVQHVWPRNDWYTRGRVLLGFGLLISGKVRDTP